MMMVIVKLSELLCRCGSVIFGNFLIRLMCVIGKWCWNVWNVLGRIVIVVVGVIVVVMEFVIVFCVCLMLLWVCCILVMMSCVCICSCWLNVVSCMLCVVCMMSDMLSVIFSFFIVFVNVVGDMFRCCVVV